MIIVLLNGCSEPNDTTMPYRQYLDGNVRSFDIYNDTFTKSWATDPVRYKEWIEICS